MSENIKIAIEGNGDLTFYRAQQDPQTGETHVIPVETMNLKKVADFAEKINEAVSLARPLAIKAEQIRATRERADNLEIELYGLPRPILKQD